MAKYRTNFELGLTDVNVIEESLSHRASALAQALRESVDGAAQDAAGEQIASLREQLNMVRTILGRIHNQKIWYQPQDYVPQG